MNVRIRYKSCKTRPNVLESVQTYVSMSTGARYRVFLFLDDMLYKIRNENGFEFVVTGGENISNLNVLKRSVKARLERLGVTFDNEIRDRNFGVCPKGYTQKKHKEQSVNQ